MMRIWHQLKGHSLLLRSGQRSHKYRDLAPEVAIVGVCRRVLAKEGDQSSETALRALQLLLGFCQRSTEALQYQ